MPDLFNEILKQITPEIVLLISSVIGAVGAKLVAIVRAWRLDRRLSTPILAAADKLAQLEKNNVIDADLAAVLRAGLTGFARNVAQHTRDATDSVERFGRQLQNPPAAANE